jgi:flavorubredoxin
MWGTTERMAYGLRVGLEKAGVPVTMRNLKTNHISDVMTEVLRSKAILIGSPTLNQGLLPTVGAFLTYLEGLRPKNRIGLAFGSYGWGGQSVTKIEMVMKNLGWNLPSEAVKIQYVPDEEELEAVQRIGASLGEVVNKE